MIQRNQSSFVDPELHPVLTERSIAYLQERGVPHDIAKAARLSSLSSHQIDYLLSRENHIASGGLGIPYHGHGEISWRVRLDEVPDQKKSGRWRWTRGEQVRPYLPLCIPSDVWQDTSAPLLVVEGPIKALAMWAAGHACVGLAGVETGHDTAAWQSSKRIQLHPELRERVSWSGRKVVIVYDAGRINNPMVAHGEARFAAALHAAGAVPYVAALPLRSDGSDQGPDDYLAKQGAEALQAILDNAQLAHPIDRIREVLGRESKREAVRMIYGWLEQLPFVASLSLGGTLLQDQAAFEVKPHIPRKAFTERVARFQAQLVGRSLAEQTGGDIDEIVTQMNQRHAVVRQGGNLSILWEEDQRYGGGTRRVVEFFAQPALELYYKNKTVVIDRGPGQPKKEQSVLQYWLRHPQRRTFDEVVFAPQGEPEGAYNLWTNFAVHPRQGDWSLLRSHLWENICSHNEELFLYLMGWMADGIQNPAKRPGTSIVLRGKEGTGKGVLVSNYGRLFGSHFLQVSNPRHFLGNFNAHLANCLFLFADEAFWAGDKSSDGILKALITEDTLNIERKGMDVVKMPNLIRMIMASNNDWVVPAGLEARRFTVIDVAETQMQNEKYFQEIQAQMDNGGREAFMYDLMHAAIPNLRSVPRTRALLDQKIYSMTPIQQFWYNRLCDGSLNEGATWAGFVPCADLYSLYVKESQLIGERRRSREIEFGLQLRKLVPQLVRKKRNIATRVYGGGTEERRVWCYHVPSLEECRAFFAKELQEHTLDWDGEEELPSNAMKPSDTTTQHSFNTSPAAGPESVF